MYQIKYRFNSVLVPNLICSHKPALKSADEVLTRTFGSLCRDAFEIFQMNVMLKIFFLNLFLKFHCDIKFVKLKYNTDYISIFVEMPGPKLDK